MKTLVIEGNASRIEIKDGAIILHYADEPNKPDSTHLTVSSKGGSANTAEQRKARSLNAAKATAARVAKRKSADTHPELAREANPLLTDEVREHFRNMQGKSAASHVENTTPEQRAEHARRMSLARWGKRDGKTDAQFEHQEAKKLIGHLCSIAKRNDEAKGA